MDNISPTPSYIQKPKQVSLPLIAHIRNNLQETCQTSPNKGVNPCPNKFPIQEVLVLMNWTITLVGVHQNLQVI